MSPAASILCTAGYCRVLFGINAALAGVVQLLVLGSTEQQKLPVFYWCPVTDVLERAAELMRRQPVWVFEYACCWVGWCFEDLET